MHVVILYAILALMINDAEYQKVRNSICTKPTKKLHQMLNEEIDFDDEGYLQSALEDELSARQTEESDPAVIGKRQHREDYGC